MKATDLIQLAKEKGFSKSFRTSGYGRNAKSDDFFIWTCLLQKWLREEKGIHIEISRSFNMKFEIVGYDFEIYKDEYIQGDNEEIFKTFELALEAGLKQSLEVQQ